ncbi:hypothetical protein D3C84_1010060 [compost metagenome]
MRQKVMQPSQARRSQYRAVDIRVAGEDLGVFQVGHGVHQWNQILVPWQMHRAFEERLRLGHQPESHFGHYAEIRLAENAIDPWTKS